MNAPNPNFIRLPLAGKSIAVVVESKFIPEEIAAYRFGFAALGAQSKSDVTTAVRPKAAPDALSAKESPQMNARILSSLLLSSLVLAALTVPALAQSCSVPSWLCLKFVPITQRPFATGHFLRRYRPVA